MVTMTDQNPYVNQVVTPTPDSHQQKENQESCEWHESIRKINGKLVLESEKPIIPGIYVKSATVCTLVEICINCCDPVNGYSGEDSNFPRVLFLMHKWFTTSEELTNYFIKCFDESPNFRSCAPSCTHRSLYQSDCLVYQYKLQVCRSLRYWICNFPIHFDTDAKLAATFRDFQLQLREKGYHILTDMVDISSVPSYDWMRKMSLRTSIRKHSRKVSLVFNHLEANELADHITYLEHKVMRRISFPDFKKYAIEGSPKDIPKLERSISLFNGLSQWVQCMVLSKVSPQQRADVIVKFVNIAKRLRELQNFNSLMAVIGGLSHSALARLSKTTMCLPTETQRILQELSDLLSSNSNFGNYRKALSDSERFRIPILGVHMKDLISLQVALPDASSNNVDMINFRKVAQLSVIFQELAEMQNSSPPIDANIDLVNTLRLSLDLVHTEDEIYDLSLQREPRSSSASSSPTRPSVMFADWAAGLNLTPDPLTIEKHTNAMIEAVFKHYDSDRDGYISREEFEAISENFPFIDSFGTLDADKDGVISKAEMKDHFMRANCLAFKTGFKHDFHETTYFKPTFCAHCTGLLWGIIKQGFKCKYCGINAHKHCKDLVVMQCKIRSTACASRSNSFAGAEGVASRLMMKTNRRKKISLNDDAFVLPKGVEYRTCKCDQKTHTIVVSEHGLREVQVNELQQCLSKLHHSGQSENGKYVARPRASPQVSSPRTQRKQSPKLLAKNLLHPTVNGHSNHREKHRSLST